MSALGLTHPPELYLGFGIPAVTSREAWFGLAALGVTAPTFFSEVLAARTDKSHIAVLPTTSAICSSRQRLFLLGGNVSVALALLIMIVD